MKEKMTIVNLDEEGWQCLYHGNVMISKGRQLDVYDVLRKLNYQVEVKNTDYIGEIPTFLEDFKELK